MNASNTVCDLPLGMDHIVEKIFYNLETADVKNCRFVSRRWAWFGAKELQRRLTISFKKEHSSMQWFEMNENIFSDQSQNGSKTLENLVLLMDNSNSISLSAFPCNSFRFYVGHLSDVGLQSFLSTHGSSIEKLEFCPLNVKVDINSISSRECVIANGLRKLLLEQTPNLKRLELHIGVSSTAISTESPMSNLDVGSVQKDDDKDASADLSKPVPVCVNTKLRVLNVWNHLPQDIFERLIEILPNLEELTLENKDLHYLIRPLPLSQRLNFNTRIHLLKNLTFEPHASNLDLLEMIANNPQDIQLREISFHFSFALYSQQEIWLRVVRVVNQILESTADSLKTIAWRRSRFLPGINFPVMKAVREIRLIHYLVPQQEHQPSADMAQDQAETQQEFDNYYFPTELCLGKSFPNLKIVRIRVINRHRYHLSLPTVSTNKSINESSITRLFNNNTVPAPSVKYIYIESMSQEVSERYRNVYLSQISQIFPNARVVSC